MSETIERLDAIEDRASRPFSPENTLAQVDADRDYLLTLVRKQAAALEAVGSMHVMEYIEDGEYSRNRCADCLYEAEGREDCPTVEAIRAALEDPS